jgi:diacylglycerol kinase (ATP)
MRIMGGGKKPDLGSGAHYAVNSLSLGFGAHAAYRMATSPRYLKGLAAYLAAILQTMVQFPMLKLKITLDDERTFKCVSTISAVMNGRSLGSSFWIAPAARIDDGLLDLVTADQLNRFTILRMIPKLMRAAHTDEPFVNFYQARQILIESDDPMIVETDGEVQFLTARRLQVEILPGRLTVICSSN